MNVNTTAVAVSSDRQPEYGKTIIVSKASSASGGTFNPLLDTTKNPIDVRGRVVDENGEPVAGATVMVKGTNKGTTTGSNGEFTLMNVDENAILEVSYVGYETKRMSVKGKNSFFDIVVKKSVNELDETVVIAYGTTTKRLNTGNVSSVKAEDIEKQPVNNPLLALQGRVRGFICYSNYRNTRRKELQLEYKDKIVLARR